MLIQQWDCVKKLDASHSQAYKVQGSRRKWIFLLALACIFYRLTKLKVYYPLSSVNTFLTIDMEYSNSVPYACHKLPEHNLPSPPPTIDMEYSNSVPYACHTLPEHNLPFPPSLLTWNILTVCHMLVIHYQSTIFPPPPLSLGTVPLYLLLINSHTLPVWLKEKDCFTSLMPVVKGLTLNSKALRFESSLATKNFPISFCGA